MSINNKVDYETINRGLIAFLDASPNGFFAVDNIRKMLREQGYEELKEGAAWRLSEDRGYYVTRNNSALIAFYLPQGGYRGYQIYASHCDSPAFKIKTNAEIKVDDKYVKLNVEKYGGMLLNTWMDRPLSIAGRVMVETEQGLETRLLNVERDLLVIPNLAIHMNRAANDGVKLNEQVDMLPVAGGIAAEGGLLQLIADELAVDSKSILDTDLFLYNRMPATVLGMDGEYISSARLDDLQCAFAGIKGFLEAVPGLNVPVYCLLDNEEVGSGTKQGAASTFLKDTLKRINFALKRTPEDYNISLAHSFMLSADNAHAVHPNHAEKADPTNKPYMNEGVVLKYSANQKYTSDAVSGAMLRALAKKAKVPVQTFANRSDILGGSTLGNISTGQVSVKCVDVGLPQLAMHSAYETAGSKDTLYLVNLAKTFFSAAIEEQADGVYEIKYF